eukprot:TRINITY_DN12398_c0_g1_i2.p1 TRINITY_DN12398_c0_g1~~TRINITY_DN12398_c0_g1_i2.p1  ORF type:complete len:508 (+),score=107.92 TRINITY_DN12398_c0_g1_i2:66-1589(+)
MASQMRVFFAMPAFAGHVNPTLGVARELVRLGVQVDFMCTCDNLKDAIEDTGSTFHRAADWQPEVYKGRHSEPPLGVGNSIMKECGVATRGSTAAAAFEARLKVNNVLLEMQLPGMLRFMEQMKPHAVVYDAMVSGTRDAYYAAKLLGIPTICVLTVAGPGTYADHVVHGGSVEELRAQLLATDCHLAATARLNSTYPGLTLPRYPEPCGLLEAADTPIIVTTTQKLGQQAEPSLDAAYRSQGTSFHYFGPLLDQEGALRGGGAAESQDAAGASVVDAARKAKAAGRKLALVSMGTVLTSNCAHGWNGRPLGADGKPRGLCGRELCQAAWAGAFESLGASSAEDGPLIILSLGPREGALGELEAPANALLCTSVPQVDILRVGVDVFLTHGGQNSFMEAISNAAPLVVCPGFGDQIMNSDKAESLGIGVKVGRPDCEPGSEAAASTRYRSAVAAALSKVLAQPSYQESVTALAKDLQAAGGVPAAAELVLKCAGARQPALRAVGAGA